MKKDKAKIITITSCKGGVGKTITTLNLAGIYERLNKSVLIIDLDIYGGNISNYVNSTNEKTIFNLIEDLSHNRYKAIDDYIFKYDNFISVLASPKDPRIANKIDSKYISLILESVLYRFDLILIDTSHILTNINIVTLDNSDSILYIFTNNAFDLKNTLTFMNIMKDVSFNNVYTLLNNSIIEEDYFSMYDMRNIIKHNIDFVLSKNFYIKNINKYIMNSEILTLNKNFISSKTDYKVFEEMAYKLISEEVKK